MSSDYVPPPAGWPGPDFDTPAGFAPPAVLDDQARRDIRGWSVQRLADVLEYMHYRACSHPLRWFGKAECGDQCHLTPDDRLVYNALVRELEDRQPEVVAYGIHHLAGVGGGRGPGLYYKYVSDLIGDVYECNGNFAADGWYIGHDDWWMQRLGLRKPESPRKGRDQGLRRDA